ncbi:multicopper oxidase domain-containing protein [Aneurinibacillus sp. Ricciae_BoGa-3]|uniref:multicopper oxidase domain-containing protein n=1 Tax=Aneurinibacillus sp. Ricciae_BoGa-3 TaxID=3022697 RepID=UPI0023400CDA|nr:multicopper oxidase domain-containing protein [Aneurinibacillus sp. Ricciae_BoGa-3]WCK52818.1 multicopper oxidase domain-containing protein [Aneurinibacillus sp. Ricciae_BoGa-3]
MKLKKICYGGLAASLLAAYPLSASAHEMDNHTNVSIMVNGSDATSNAHPYFDSHHRLMASVRVVAESLGATVKWDAKHHAVLINTPSFPVNLHSNTAFPVLVNGQLVKTNGTAIQKTNRIIAPARSIAEALNAEVSWDQEAQLMDITSRQAVDEFNSEEAKVKDVLEGTGLTPHIAADGTKEFTLVAEPHIWEPVKGAVTQAWTYNGQVPGPVIRVTEGDHVRITLVNKLPEPTITHWHGLHLPNAMDGVPDITQKPVQPGQSFTYEFTASHPGTFMYHSHFDDMKQVGKGLRGAFIIDPKDPKTETKYDHDYTMLLSGFHMQDTTEGEEDYFTMNGRSYPYTQPLVVKKGETVRLRLINIDPTETHTMHLHGMDFQVIAKDGHPSSNPQKMNTLLIGPGETYDIAFTADAVGSWMFHCHILDHTMNAGSKMGQMGGLVTVIKVHE